MQSQGGRDTFTSETGGVVDLHTKINSGVSSPNDSTYIKIARNQTGHLYGNGPGIGFNTGEVTFRIRALNDLDPIDVTLRLQILVISTLVDLAVATITVPTTGTGLFADYTATVSPETGKSCGNWPTTGQVLFRVEVLSGANGAASERLKISEADYQLCDTGC